MLRLPSPRVLYFGRHVALCKSEHNIHGDILGVSGDIGRVMAGNDMGRKVHLAVHTFSEFDHVNLLNYGIPFIVNSD